MNIEQRIENLIRHANDHDKINTPNVRDAKSLKKDKIRLILAEIRYIEMDIRQQGKKIERSVKEGWDEGVG